MIDSIVIPTANLGFSTMTSSKKVLPNDCDNDRQPEIAIRACARQRECKSENKCKNVQTVCGEHSLKQMSFSSVTCPVQVHTNSDTQ